MTEEDKQPQCLQCGVGAEGNVLIQCLKEGEDAWVCASCLPILIHGAH